MKKASKEKVSSDLARTPARTYPTTPRVSSLPTRKHKLKAEVPGIYPTTALTYHNPRCWYSKRDRSNPSVIWISSVRPNSLDQEQGVPCQTTLVMLIGSLGLYCGPRPGS